MDRQTAELVWIVERLLVLEVERNPNKTKREIIERWESAGTVPKRIGEILRALK